MTATVLEQAIERGRQRDEQSPHAVAVRYMPAFKSLLIGFADHAGVILPIANYVELADMTEGDLGQLRLELSGYVYRR